MPQVIYMVWVGPYLIERNKKDSFGVQEFMLENLLSSLPNQHW